MENDEKTKEVEILLGDPKKAIIAIAIPTAIALIAQSINNLTDAAWVAGLGPDALAAIGIIFPLFIIIIGISNGIGIGAASAISKRIGAENKAGADSTASHAIILILLASVVMTILMVLFMEPLIRLVAGDASESTIQECINYAVPIAMFTFVFMIVGVLSSILRSEGAAKRSMIILILAAVINAIIDPFFIYDYGLGWGMTGAAAATLIAESVAMGVMIYWYFIKKDLFLNFRFKKFVFEREIIKDIFRVGLPASVELIIMSLVMVIMNILLLTAGGDNAIAIYSSDWRIISILAIPMMGIASGVVPVCAAAYGAKRADKIKIAFNYSLKVSVVSMLIIGVVTMILAPQILTVFTYDESTHYLKDGMTEFLRIACVFLPFMAMGAVASSFFQSVGMGMKSLISSLFRNFLALPICYVAMIMTTGMTYIWWGVTISEIVGCVLILVWSVAVLKKISKEIDIRFDNDLSSG